MTAADFWQLLSLGFARNALLAAVLASVACGLVGTYVVTRRLVFVSGGITHASFGGIGIAVFLGLNPIVSAMAFAVAGACGAQWLSRKGRVREDSAIATLWTTGMAVGIIFSFLTPGFVPDLSSYLFGSILAVGKADLWVLLAVDVAVAATFAALCPVIVAVSFDPVFARSQRLPVAAVEYLMMTLTAMTIVATLRLVGIVLAMSLLTLPQMTASLLTHDYRRLALASIGFALAYCLGGLAVSFWLNVPSGAAIIAVSVAFYGTFRTIKTLAARFIKE